MIYLDNAATTKPDASVIEVMMKYCTAEYANPSAAYSFAGEARSAVAEARRRTAELIGAAPEEIYFTSGATESNTAVMRGICDMFAGMSEPVHVVTAAFEHPSVLENLKSLPVEVTYLRPDSDGMISVESIEAAIRPNTRLVSIMTANNETGTIQPIAAIGELAHGKGCLFHTDAVQALGQIRLDVNAMNIDLLSGSSHKLHGPRGVGLLYIRRGVRLPALIKGGGQERGFRSGTENTAGIAGFGRAAELALSCDMTGTAHLRDLLLERIVSAVDGVQVNGSMKNRLPGNLNISFDRVQGSSLLINLDMAGICCSTGSACAAGHSGLSHVLMSMGFDRERIEGSLRFSLSRYTTEEEIEKAAAIIIEQVARLRRMTL